MLGLAKGILADGQVQPEEVHLISAWLDAHPGAWSSWPGNILADRLRTILADGQISDIERRDLHELLTDLVGGRAGIIGTENAASKLPLDKPAPTIKFPKRVFVLTGKFAFGPRSICEESTEAAGGVCEAAITRRTNYLVVGTFGSRDWIQTSHGRKIEKAMEYRNSGQSVAIVGEDHWAESLP
jgi:NAD-dependent DNA ligase